MWLYKQKKLSIILAVVGICVFVITFFFLLSRNKKTIEINNHIFLVDVADTQQKRIKGLSSRKELCDSCGMLFLFDNFDKHAFWMKDMLFDIDIIWIKDNTVVAISKNVSHKTPYHIIIPPIPINVVIELPAGTSDAIHLKTGDRYTYQSQ